MHTSSENAHRYPAMFLTATVHVIFFLFLFLVAFRPAGTETKYIRSGSGPELVFLGPVEDVPQAPASSGAEKFLSPAREFISTQEEEPISAGTFTGEEHSPDLDAVFARLRLMHRHAGETTGIAAEPGGNSEGDELEPGGYPGIELSGRKLLRAPDRLNDATDEGTVVVGIVVDETGKVIRASPGKRGTTTTNAGLWKKAKEAAMNTRFDASPDGQKEQAGRCTFVFTLE